VPTAPPTTSATSTVNLSAGPTAQTASFAAIASGLSGQIALPPATAGTGTATATLSTTNPSGVPAVQSVSRLPASIGVTLTPLAYVTMVTSAALTFATYPAFTFVFPAGTTFPSGTSLFLAQFVTAQGGWVSVAGPAAVNGTTVTFATIPGPITFPAGQTQTFALFSTTSSVVTSSAFNCPTSGAPNSVARTSALSGESVNRQLPKRIAHQTTSANTLLAVTYSRAAVTANLPQISARESSLGASFLKSFDSPDHNASVRIVSVPAAQAAQAEAQLRAQSGVQSVGRTGERRFHTTTASLPTNDPYFKGFLGTSAPYFETNMIPGQWDMYAIGLDHAYGYSTATGGSGTYAPTPLALGSSSVKIAIIDTGVDSSHPELGTKVAYQRCFITNVAGTVQSTGNFATDGVGHGTDVAGIAAAATNNGFGFTGAGGNAVIYAYRVFPTPDDTCASDTGADDQCSSATQDIASAINDAVAQNVNVISMSLGGGSCTSGQDSDSVEGAAVANAIAHNVIVVAASGNSGPAPLGVTAPGCDTGVIAVGATSLDDGTPTGTTSYSTPNVSTASAAHPVEYVASYSQYDATNTLHSASSWGIVAPGGDPAASESSGTANNLHWIEHIWTTKPFMSSPSDTNFAGNCTNDFPSTLTTNPDCRTLIAGTSMSTPHVAGAAALLLAVNPGLQNPTAMKAALCSWADDLADTHQGCGRLNIYRSIAHAIGDTNPP
jgi:hypothetical protein